MAQESALSRNVWWVVMIVSLLFLAFNVFAMSDPGSVLETALSKYAGSSFDLGELDKATRGFLDMSMIKPLWEGLWVVVFGIFIALKLKQMKKYAWTLGIMWSAMILAYGVIQGGYEMVILGWSSPCFQSYLFLGFGIIPLGCLLVAKKGFSQYEE
jgi:hypothetical protein